MEQGLTSNDEGGYEQKNREDSRRYMGFGIHEGKILL
jgi:hypothetical protein